MTDEKLVPFDLQSATKLALTYPLVWGYQQAFAPHLNGLVRLSAVVLVTILTWIVLNRTLFPATFALYDHTDRSET